MTPEETPDPKQTNSTSSPPPTVDDTISPEIPAMPGEVTNPGSGSLTPQSAMINETAPAAISNTGPVMSTASSAQTGPAKKRRRSSVAIIVIALLVLLGGVVAAYYAYVLPNQPEEVLKTAIENTLQQKTANLKGSFAVDSTDPAHPNSFKVDLQSSSDVDAKAADIMLTFTTSGISFPVEARLVDQNLYLKVGDLTTLVSFLNTLSPQIGNIAKLTASKLSNKWIVFDSTLLKQGGGSCFLDKSWALTKTDIQYLEKQYESNKFVDIKNAADDTVDGRAAKKFVLSIDNDKGTNYFKALDQMPTLKALNDCSKSKAQPLSTKLLADGDHTPLTVWVDKASKRIIKIEAESTAQDTKKNRQKGKAALNINYDKVTVSAPENAEPALKVFAEIEQELSKDPAFQTLFGGRAANSFSF